jgi:6-pyruvoyl-tetrahydropterin synthase
MTDSPTILGPAEMCIERTLEFHAAHQLAACSESPECMQVHGHSYKLQAQWRLRLPDDGAAFLNAEGMIANFARLKRLLARVEALFDHTFINDVELPALAGLGRWSFGAKASAGAEGAAAGPPPELRPSTAENLTLWIFHYLHELASGGEADLRLPAGFELAELRLWETPKNCVVYRRGGQGGA